MPRYYFHLTLVQNCIVSVAVRGYTVPGGEYGMPEVLKNFNIITANTSPTSCSSDERKGRPGFNSKYDQFRKQTFLNSFLVRVR